MRGWPYDMTCDSGSCDGCRSKWRWTPATDNEWRSHGQCVGLAAPSVQWLSVDDAVYDDNDDDEWWWDPADNVDHVRLSSPARLPGSSPSRRLVSTTTPARWSTRQCRRQRLQLWRADGATSELSQRWPWPCQTAGEVRRWHSTSEPWRLERATHRRLEGSSRHCALPDQRQHQVMS